MTVSVMSSTGMPSSSTRKACVVDGASQTRKIADQCRDGGTLGCGKGCRLFLGEPLW